MVEMVWTPGPNPCRSCYAASVDLTRRAVATTPPSAWSSSRIQRFISGISSAAHASVRRTSMKAVTRASTISES